MRCSFCSSECEVIKEIIHNEEVGIFWCPVCREFRGKTISYNVCNFFEDPRNLRGFIAKKMSDAIQEKYIFKTFRDTGEILIYQNDEGIYNNGIAESIIKANVRGILGDKCNIHYVNETIAAIKDTTYVDRELFNDDKMKLVLLNGVFDIETFEIVPHNPDFLFTVRIPINYNPTASCPEFLKWLENKVKDEDMRVTIQEMFGYCLLKSNNLQKAFLLYGSRRTGKSTLLNVLRMMLGLENITAMSLQFLNEDNFALAYVYGKLANICADLSSRALKDTGKFMLVTGEDAITIARKREHPFTFVPWCKFIFSCNVIPATIYNKDMAFYRRWVLLNFKEETLEDDVDDHMLDKISNESELEGIFLWAVEGLKRLITNGKLSYPLDEYQVRDLYERNSDSINSFIFNCVEEDDSEKVKKRVVYGAYKEYCIQNKLKVENQIMFGRVFREVTGCGTSTIDNIPAYVGVKLKEYKKVMGELDKWL